MHSVDVPERPAAEIISQLVGQVILDLHKHGKIIQQPTIVSSLRQRQETEPDEIQRCYLALAVRLLSL
ncbi:hypothetical protein SJI19_18890 [Acerihabitans sp. TG2]|uniref:hypothetical protein n=1 Tax=Acerihabitans sp. TG2 TaxID=3096008 RepID=UPI002B23950A|nr:hypothetical protein [Acerihabitans sp. TG2]MEA9392580.1 hypothetical protein [Acerihabitans sp. TG2]